jgi:hypothetical protein
VGLLGEPLGSADQLDNEVWAAQLQLKRTNNRVHANEKFAEVKAQINDILPGAALIFSEYELHTGEPASAASTASTSTSSRTTAPSKPASLVLDYAVQTYLPMSLGGDAYPFGASKVAKKFKPTATCTSNCEEYHLVPPDFLKYHDISAEPSFSGVNMLMAGVHSAALRRWTRNDNISINVGVRPFPYRTDSEGWLPDTLMSMLCNLLLPLSASFMLPVVVHTCASEEELGLRQQMSLAGLRPPIYWACTYVRHLPPTAIAHLLIFSLGVAAKVPTFVRSSTSLLYTTLMMWSFCLPAFACAFASLFTLTSVVFVGAEARVSSKIAAVAAVLLLICSVVVSFVVNADTFDAHEHQLEPAPPSWLLFPPFAFFRALWLLNSRGFLVSEVHLGGIDDGTNSSVGGTELASLWLALGVHTFVSLGLSIAFDILVQRFRLNPSFFTETMLAVLPASFKFIRHNAQTTGSQIGQGDEDVHAERQHVLEILRHGRGREQQSGQVSASASSDKGFGSGSGSGDDDVTWIEQLQEVKQPPASDEQLPLPQLIVAALSKQYAGQKHLTVAGLNIRVRAGECFGLLGPNGAGKTTSIKMLTGLQCVSAGNAFVCGRSVRAAAGDKNDPRELIGVCPQFDLLFPELTVRCLAMCAALVVCF